MQRDTGLTVFFGDYHYKGISSQCNKYSGQLPVRLPHRMEIEPPSFSQGCQIFGKQEINLFTSCLSHQVPQCIALIVDPFIQDTGAMQQNWSNKLLCAIPPSI